MTKSTTKHSKSFQQNQQFISNTKKKYSKISPLITVKHMNMSSTKEIRTCMTNDTYSQPLNIKKTRAHVDKPKNGISCNEKHVPLINLRCLTLKKNILSISKREFAF